MLTIYYSKSFRKSYKRLIRSGSFDSKELNEIIDTLASKNTLPPGYKDHPLQGKLAELRECHLEFDLLLIYQISSGNILKLVDIGTHSTLFQ